MSDEPSGTRVVPTTCSYDCGGSCRLLAHVRDGVLIRLDTADEAADGGNGPPLRACARGRAQRQRVYSPDRLTHPLQRVGPRGSGKFEHISWEQAVDSVASKLRRIRETHGPAAILDLSTSGNTSGVLHGSARVAARFFNMGGGRTSISNTYSVDALSLVVPHVLGVSLAEISNDRADLLNSKLIVLWGWNPAELIFGSGTSWYLARAREAGARIICIDPRLTDSCAALAHQWIPLRPGTDVALMTAMAYVIISERLCQRAFLDSYTVGFAKYEDYVMGGEDGVDKTPEWASQISGVPAQAIVQLAREYATTKPAALMAGWGPQRAAHGEQWVQACITLAAMTGNIGSRGGSSGLAGGFGRFPRVGALRPGRNPAGARVPAFLWPEAVIGGKEAGFPSDIRMIYAAGGNLLNQQAGVRRNIEAFHKVECVVVHEQFLTPTASYADIVLPVCTFLERNDIVVPWGQGDYLLYANKAIEPVGECKTDLDIFSELAERLGFAEQFTEGKGEEDWLREFVAQSDIPDYEEFKTTGIYREEKARPFVAFADFVADPAANLLRTPSGRIEVYCQALAEMGAPGYAKYLEAWESPTDPLAEKYPLQLITPHPKLRVHSTGANTPWLQELEEPTAWLHPADAEVRGIEDGDVVSVFNDRGELVIKARVTERIMPGVVSISEGMWYRPDLAGVDWGGNPNVVNSSRPTLPSVGASTHTTLVQARKR